MSLTAKIWLRNLLLGLILAFITSISTGYIVVQRADAVNTYKLDEYKEDIVKIESACDSKADKVMVMEVKQDLNERLKSLEAGQTEIQRDIKELLKRK